VTVVPLVVAVGVIGTLIGSFLNVVVHRVPAGRSVVAPPSSCGECGHAIRPYDNIPILSWLLLRGRCRDCGTRISARYPLVEVGTAVLFVLVGVRLLPGVIAAPTGADAAAAGLELVAYLYLAAIGVALALIDLDVHRLPNAIVLPGYVVGAVLLGTAALVAGEPDRLGTAAIGLGAMFGLYLLLAVVRPGGMGMGDVKLAGVLGLFLGYLGFGPLAVGALAAFLLGGLYSAVLLATKRADRRSGIPFGPWMLAGAAIGILLGDGIAAAYLSLFGLTAF